MREKILHLLRITNMDVDALAESLEGSMVASLRDQLGDSEAVSAAVAKVQKSLADHRDGFVDEVCAAYAETHTEEDVDAAIAFFSSPSGAKFTQSSRPLLERSMAAANEWRGRAMAAIEKDLLELLSAPTAEVAGKSPSAQPPATTK